MVSPSNALLVCVIFLCGLEDSALSPHGHCAGSRCFALFQESGDFPGAQKSCRDSGGQLLPFSPGDPLTVLPSGLSGGYWLELRGGGGTPGEGGVPHCSSISVSTGGNVTVSWEPCGETLNGFLCQYAFEEPCGGLRAGGGTRVKYTASAPMGFEVRDSETFPPGTIALAGRVGATYPDSKHVCFEGGWTRAPWNCEVLRGGCEGSCNSTACGCPAGQALHPNRISCTADPCAACAHGCQREGDTYACDCRRGYRLARDGRSCADVDECAERSPCAGEGEECVNTPGGFECRCADGFDAEDGACVDVSVCERCEHMLCDKVDGAYRCLCGKGFRVSPVDPTKCDLHCAERDCPASCVPDSDRQEDVHQCFCPDGYIVDVANGTPVCSDINECALERQCDHTCVNLFGSYRCLCDEGFELRKGYMCEAIEDGEGGGEDNGSGSTPPHPTPASIRPAAVPSYVKTGSILGIAVFLLLAVALTLLLAQHAAKRCGRFELPPVKHSNLDIFYLQQVTSETYKRLSFDKQCNQNDSQML